MIFTIILQFNQGYLRLYHWMLFGILDGMIIYYNRKLRFINRTNYNALLNIGSIKNSETKNYK